ncbi:MAG TPA: flavodoxin family protein [Polyangia bacterium]
MPQSQETDEIDVRKGQAEPYLSREEFRKRWLTRFYDPAFQAEAAAIDRLEAIAWDAYHEGRKAPLTQAAGPEFKDPNYKLSLEWLDARRRIRAAAARQADPASPRRILVICGASRNDQTCPGEISKSFRLAQIAQEALSHEGSSAGALPGPNLAVETDLLDLSLLTSEHGRHIHPCKGCVSTAMPLCHWPCSCYPNHSLGQINDWMNEIYERWTAAHGVIIVTPVYWYQVASGVKLMMDRLVCADGGNPDPTSTGGKDPKKAKRLELEGWPYPKHLEGRAYGVVVHGDVAGIEGVRRSLCDWLEWMGLVDAGSRAKLDRFIGYYEPYATSHATLDRDTAVQDEVRNVARAVAGMVAELRAGRGVPPDRKLKDPRPK